MQFENNDGQFQPLYLFSGFHKLLQPHEAVFLKSISNMSSEMDSDV